MLCRWIQLPVSSCALRPECRRFGCLQYCSGVKTVWILVFYLATSLYVELPWTAIQHLSYSVLLPAQSLPRRRRLAGPYHNSGVWANFWEFRSVAIKEKSIDCHELFWQEHCYSGSKPVVPEPRGLSGITSCLFRYVGNSCHINFAGYCLEELAIFIEILWCRLQEWS